MCKFQLTAPVEKTTFNKYMINDWESIIVGLNFHHKKSKHSPARHQNLMEWKCPAIANQSNEICIPSLAHAGF